MAATVVAISTSESKGVRKENVGRAELEAGHGIRGDAHAGCVIFKEVGDCVMPREGVFAKVTRGGSVEVGDPVRVMTDV